jgi:hypothetical protein
MYVTDHAMAMLIYMPYREQVSQFKSEQSGRFKGLDLTTQKIIDAIIQQQDVFEAAHDTQIALMGTIHRDTISMIQDEHAITRREIRDLQVRLLSGIFTTLLNCF